jgi:hypothetical protein
MYFLKSHAAPVTRDGPSQAITFTFMRAFALLISLLCEQDYLISRVNAM